MDAAKESNIPAYLGAGFFQQVLECGLRRTNIEVRDVTLRNLTKGGENYCSNIYHAVVKFQVPADDIAEEDERSLIIKSLPQQKQGVLKRLSIYVKETLFYYDIMPKMETLMWYKENPWFLATKHYYSTTNPEETIVIEDLSKQRFELRSRQLGLDEHHARIVMQKLAEYHALSMVMIEKEPEVIVERFPYGLLNIDSIKSPAFKALFGAHLLKLAALVGESAEYKDISKKLLKYYDNFTERVLKAVYPLMGGINVLNHGDLWINNIFFRNGSNDSPVEVRFIDFQLCFCGSPGFDINYFFQTSVQFEVLEEQRYALIEIYYTTLIETLKRLPYDKPLPSYEQVLTEVQEREAYGLFVAFAFFPLMSMVGKDSLDNSLKKLQNADFAQQKIELMFHSNARTLQTLKYVLNRAQDLGILD